MEKFKVRIEVEVTDEDESYYKVIDGGGYVDKDFDTKAEAFSAMDRMLEVAY